MLIPFSLGNSLKWYSKRKGCDRTVVALGEDEGGA